MPYATSATTGVPDGVTLTSSGGLVITKAGAVIDGLDIRGSVEIRADNVTIQNCKITSTGFYGVSVSSGVTGAIVKNNDIDGLGQGQNSRGIAGHGTFIGNDIRGFENGVNVEGSDTLIKGNYIHDLKAAGSDPHYDGIQAMGGFKNLVIEGNSILARDTAAIFVDNMFGAVDNVQIRNNYLKDDGSYTIYVLGDRGGHYPVSNVVIENNYIDKATWGWYSIEPDSSGRMPTVRGNMEVTSELPPEQAPWLGSTEPSTPTTPAPSPTPTPGVINGTSGNDTLSGTTGADTLTGLGGNDTYVVNHTGDTVVEASGGGSDLVRTSISHTLAANVENVKLTGTTAINATGNGLNNFLDGNDGVNVLSGGGGDDILNGRYGGDTLWGNAGRDTFQFTSKWSADDDMVMDFVRGTDKLDFSGIDANPATAGDQMFIFDGTKGTSFSGSDGHIWAVTDSGAGVTHLNIKTEGSVAQVQVAGTGYTLAASDFLL